MRHQQLSHKSGADKTSAKSDRAKIWVCYTDRWHLRLRSRRVERRPELIDGDPAFDSVNRAPSFIGSNRNAATDVDMWILSSNLSHVVTMRARSMMSV